MIKRNNGKRSVTIMATFVACGESLPPFFVFPYERVPTIIKQTIPSGWGIGNSKKGWMTNECFPSYLREHLLPSLKSISGIKFPILLCVDGVSSHISLDVAVFCRENRIILYALLANMSHILQPADVAIFGPLKKKWFHGTRHWLIEHGEPTSMHNVAKVFETVWKDVSPDVTRSGFKAYGLYPFEPDAVDYSKVVPVRIELFDRLPPLSQHLSLDNPSQSPQEHETTKMPTPEEDDVTDAPTNSAYKFLQEKLMPVLPSVAQYHVETTIDDTLLSEFRKTREEGGHWNGDIKHTSLFDYWIKFYPNYQIEALDQLATAIPPLSNPVAPAIRSSKRINAIKSEESLLMLRERKRKKDIHSGNTENSELNDPPSDERDPCPPPSPINKDANQVEPIEAVTENDTSIKHSQTTASLDEKCNICGKLLKDAPKKRGRDQDRNQCYVRVTTYIKENGSWKCFDDERVTVGLNHQDIGTHPNHRRTVLIYVMELLADS